MKNNKPFIGVVPLWDDDKNSLWMLPGYFDALTAANALPAMLTLTSDACDIRNIVDHFDGFLLTGGQDVSPALYQEKKRKNCGELCKARDTMESLLVEAAISADKPIFGICRGIQFLNAFLGGTLYQDIPTELPTKINHDPPPPYNVPIHSVEVFSFLQDLLETSNIEVNSSHHQGIKALSPKLKSCAIAPDGLIEGVFMPDKRFVLAVQWHPECTLDWSSSRKLFSAFVNVCLEK